MTLLSTEKLTKSFGSLVVSKEIDLAVAAGERHAIIGPNGAGKTSLVNQLAGQLRPSSGRIVLNGADVTNYSPEARSLLGLARTFQRNNLFRNLSVLENVRLAVQRRRGNPINPWRATDHDRTTLHRSNDILEMSQLSARAKHTANSLSYGEQRQLEIAMALACEPKVLLLDEPTSGMSPAETERTTRLIESLPRDIGILIIEHDMQVVFTLADRVTVLYYGTVLATGTPQEISANDTVRDVYLGRRQTKSDARA